LLALPGVEDIEFEVSRARDLARPADLMFLLDTNVVSELRKIRSGKSDRNVSAWADSVDAADLFVCHDDPRIADRRTVGRAP
jgi:hypothetical protein